MGMESLLNSKVSMRVGIDWESPKISLPLPWNNISIVETTVGGSIWNGIQVDFRARGSDIAALSC